MRNFAERSTVLLRRNLPPTSKSFCVMGFMIRLQRYCFIWVHFHLCYLIRNQPNNTIRLMVWTSFAKYVSKIKFLWFWGTLKRHQFRLQYDFDANCRRQVDSNLSLFTILPCEAVKFFCYICYFYFSCVPATSIVKESQISQNQNLSKSYNRLTRFFLTGTVGKIV
jgi:hypothetical protein